MAQLQSTVVSGNTNITGIVSAGARKLSMGILELNSGGTPTQFRINTTIPYSSGNADFTVNIKGFRYGNAEMTSLSIGWHFYNSEFYNRTAICNGAWAPTITLARDANGYVVIHLAGPGYWPKMYVESVYSGNYNDAYSTGWTWTDADLSDCTAAQTVPYKALATNITGSAGSTDFNNLTNKTGGTGTYQTSGDFRAPIFYDSQNTNYYLDPNGQSELIRIRTNTNWYDNSATDWGGGVNMSGNNPSIGFQPTSSSWWYMLHHSTYMNFYRRNTSGNWNQDGIWDTSGNLYWNNGIIQSNVSMRAPIFYDSQNTGYYVDPNSTSVLYYLQLNASESMGLYGIRGRFTNEYMHLYSKVGVGHPGGWGQGEGNTPVQGLSTYGGINIAYGNNTSSVFNGDVGIGVSAISRLHVQAASPAGVGGSPTGTVITVDSTGNNLITFRNTADNGTYAGLAFLDNNIGGYVVFGNSGANPSDSMAIAGYNGGVLQYGTANSVNPAARTTVVSWNSTGLQVNNGDLRASIFYDINDTSYYVDPNSTSRLNILTTAYLNGHYTNTSAYNSSNTLIATPSGIRSQAAFITFTDGNAIAPYAMYRTSGDWPAPYGIGWGTGGESSGIFQQYASNNYSLGDMTFYINNDGVGRFKWVMGGWEGTTYNPSGSNNYNNAVMTLDNSGNLQASASMRAPIFYDSDNTAYYLDPASTSNLNGLTVGGSSVVTNNGATWGISINGNAATATTASNANALGGNGPSYYYPANTPNGYAAGDINGNTTHQRLWGTDSVQNLLAFRPPTSIEYSTNGSTWVSTSATDGLWDNKIFGKWGGFNMNVGNNIGGWRYVRMTWVNFGYHFFSNFTLAHSTNGHSFNFVFYKSDLSGNFGAEAFRMNGISSWPGYTFVKYSDVSGWWDTRDVRMVFELNYNSSYPDNAISIGHIGLMGSYSGFTRLYDWDGSRNMYFANNATASASFRAPIFYDSDNTSYYLDPASGSNLNSVVTVETKARKNQTAGNYTTAALWTESYGNTATGIAFHISGNVGKFLEMRTDGTLYWNGDTVMHSGNSTYAWNMNQYVRTTDTVSFRNLQSAYQVLNLDTQKAPGLYNYDGGIGGTQPLGTNWYNVRTIEIGDASRYSQFVMPYADTRIFYRINQGSWQPYVELLHSSNYSSFSLPLSGGTMTGSINFANAQDNVRLNKGGNWLNLKDPWNNFHLRMSDGGSIYMDAPTYFIRPADGSTNWVYIDSSQLTHSSSLRAPIFYDSNDTNYYLDPASTGTSLRVAGNLVIGQANGWSSIYMGDTDEGQREIHCNSNRIGFLTQAGSWSSYSDDSNNWYAEGSMRSPIFYSSTDTNYYLYPASTGTSLTVAGTMYGARLLLGSGTSEGAIGNGGLRIGRTDTNYTHGSAWSGTSSTMFIDCATTATITIHDSGNRLVEYLTYSGDATNTIYTGRSIGWGTTNWVFGDVASAIGSFRAPIFYDSDNTSYYLDPNATTSIRTVGSWRSDSGAWDGEFSGKIQYHANHWYFQAADLWLFRNAGGSNVFSVTQGGNGAFSGSLTTNGQVYINNGDPTIFLMDSNHRSSMIHCNSNIFYILRGSGNNSTSWATFNGYWPLELSLETNDAVFGRNITAPVGTITAGNDMRAPIFYDSNDTTYYADFNNTGRSMYTAGYLQSDRMIMKGSSGGGQIYPTIAYGGMSMYGGDSLTNGAWITVTGISYGSSPGAGSAEIIVRSEASSKIAMWTYNGSTYTGRAALWGSNGNFVIGSATTDYGYKLYVDGTIYATGNVIAYSDESVKTNVREIENPLARVLNTRGVIYDRIDNEDKDNIGFIAQELEKEFPELVSTGNNGKKGVMYQNMVAVLIEAMKEQNKEIQKLKMLINGASR
jgi:hypothetical protein